MLVPRFQPTLAMSDYKRAYQPGALYFFTVVTHQRRPIFSSHGNVKRLRDAFLFVRSKRPFKVEAIVVLPDHIHCIWRMWDDPDFSLRWRLIKTYFSRFSDPNGESNQRERIWQPRFWEHLIRDDEDFWRHLHYIHFNPVKHGYVTRPADWPHSSFGRFVRLGWYEKDWGQVQPELITNMNPE